MKQAQSNFNSCTSFVGFSYHAINVSFARVPPDCVQNKDLVLDYRADQEQLGGFELKRNAAEAGCSI